MYQVFDNNKPAQYPDHKVDPSWNTSIFNTFEEAERYALNWLGEWGPSVERLQPDIVYMYSWGGDTLVIKTLSTP